MSDLFVTLIFNLILFFVVFYISQNYKELFSKVDSLTFRINYINIVLLSFIPIFESGTIKYYKEEYVFLLFYFIIYIALSVKFSFLKRTTILCITVPYLIFYDKILEWIIGDEELLFIILINFIQTVMQYRKEKLYKKIVLSTLIIPLIIFSIPMINIIKEKVEEKQLLHKIENSYTSQTRIDYIFEITNIEKREKVLEQFGLDYKSQLSKLDSKVRNNFNLLMAFKIRNINYKDVIKNLDYIVKSEDKYEALSNLVDKNEIIYLNNFMMKAKKLKKEREELEKKFNTEKHNISYSEFLYKLNSTINSF